MPKASGPSTSVMEAAEPMSTPDQYGAGSVPIINPAVKITRLISKHKATENADSTFEVVGDLASVLSRYNLPADVSSAVASAVAAKQLPSKPASLDALLRRLLLPGSGLKPELVHAGKMKIMVCNTSYLLIAISFFPHSP